MGNGVSVGLDILSAGLREMGQHPTTQGFSLQDKWDKEINALYMLGEVCAGKSLP